MSNGKPTKESETPSSGSRIGTPEFLRETLDELKDMIRAALRTVPGLVRGDVFPSISHARAGAEVVAPSDMMDGRVRRATSSRLFGLLLELAILNPSISIGKSANVAD
jgi:hypothetical protein